MRQKRLNNKELRLLAKELPIAIGKGREVFEVEHPRGDLLVIDGLVSFFMYNKKWRPTLQLLYETTIELPAVYVDKGAIPFVVKGADVMRPGIVTIVGEFERGDLLVIRDSNHGRALGVGIAYVNHEEMKEAKTGKMVKNIHHFGDWIWKLGQ